MFFRIQSLFLTIAAGLLISMFFAPMIRFVGEDTVIHFIEVAAFKGFTLTTIFQIVCAVLSIVTLVSFKNRIRQIRLCNLNTIILIAYQIVLAVYFFQRDSNPAFFPSAPPSSPLSPCATSPATRPWSSPPPACAPARGDTVQGNNPTPQYRSTC